MMDKMTELNLAVTELKLTDNASQQTNLRNAF